MSSKSIEMLLEECLAAYDAGLAPDECLSAFPEAGAQLEPLFRQALSLRFAFANAPSDDYQREARERFLFAAGRDVSAAFVTEPDEEFVMDSRQRFIFAAGAAAQEALRDVPPPRLPFWANARRRLLEAAAMSMARPRPARRPVSVPSGLYLRSGLSAAVVVLALTIAGLALITSGGGPKSVDAEYAQLNAQVQDVQDQIDNGQNVPASVIVDLSRRTNELAAKLTDTSSPVATKLPDLIDRQRELVASVSDDTPDAVVEQATKDLNSADIRLAAARLDQTTPVVSSTAASSNASTPEPEATASPSPTTPAPLNDGEIRITPLSNDRTVGLRWTEVRTTDLRFVYPTEWKLIRNQATSSKGLVLRIDSNEAPDQPPKEVLFVDLDTGEVSLLFEGRVLVLRGEGAKAEKIDADDLIAALGSDATDTITIFHILESITTSGDLAP